MATPAQSMAWLQQNKRWFLPLAIGVPLVVGALGFGGTAVLVMHRLKASEPYRPALAAVRDSEAGADWLGAPLQPGFIVQGSVEPLPALTPGDANRSAGRPGPPGEEANLMFSVTGPRGGAGVRAYLIRRDDPQDLGDGGWTLHYLDAGVSADGREKIITVIDTGERPPALRP